MLLITGVGANRTTWRQIRPALSNRFRTIAFDLRDSGSSCQSSVPYDAGDLALDALDVMDAAGSRHAHILGHSLGGAIALEIAMMAPSRITSLTLVSAFGRSDQYMVNTTALLKVLTEHVKDDRSLRATLLFLGMDVGALSDIDLLKVTDASIEAASMPPRSALLRQWQAMSTVDIVDRVGNLSVPTHVIWGTADGLVPPWLSSELAREIPAASATPIEGSGHMTMVTNPKILLEAMNEFWDAISQGSR